MKHASSLLLAAAGLAAAQHTTVVEILFPQTEGAKFVGSVVSAGPTATAYKLHCEEDKDSTALNLCGLFTDIDVTYGPKTWAYAMTILDQTVKAQCSLDPVKDLGDCTALRISSASTETVHDTIRGYKSELQTVTVTDGGAEETTTTTAAPTGSATDKVTETGTGTEAPSNTDAPSSSDDAAATTTTASTGGMPRITQNAAILGAAALVGGAMML